MTSPLFEALEERGYHTLTPVQEAMIDPELEGRDLLVSAQTGSGKTVAFGLAIAPTLLGESDWLGQAGAPLALIVAPTRELAGQVMFELRWLYRGAGARVASCVGGMDMRDERRALERGAHIVVGTPGRLVDHIRRGSLVLDDIRAVVLDEADEMLDLGFREDLEFMLGEAPEQRRTLLFSATVSPGIAKLAESFQKDAERISTITGKEQHADISYQVLRVAHGDVEPAIFNLLRFHEGEGAIIFANTRASVAHLTARLANRGFAVVSLSGELSQNERSHALQAMRDGRAKICVATDVAARGIDLPNLSLVIHADLPTNTESLLHRSGRTGRAGRKGISALVVDPRSFKKAERLLKWAKINAEWTDPPSAEAILAADEERLLRAPEWEDDLTEEQTAFAQKLLAERSPEEIAAGFLRLYRTRRAAPEELGVIEARPPKRDPKSFGPSKWFALSVGRKDRAEARWLLPLLCRAGDIDKTAIGAIRVQEAETFVEISEAALEGFRKAVGDDGVLEEGLTARELETAPDLPAERRGPKPRPKGGDHRKGPARSDRPARKAPEPRKEPWAKPSPAEKPAPSKAAEPAEAPKSHKPRPSKKPGGQKPAFEGKRPPKGGDARPTRKGPGKPKTTGKRKPGKAAPDPRDTSKRFERPKGR